MRVVAVATLLALAGCTGPRDDDGGTLATTTSERHDLTIEIEDDRMTMRAQRARIGDVLHEISRRARLTIIADAPPQGTVTLRFENATLPDALRQVLEGRSYLLHESRDTRGGTRIALYLFSTGTAAPGDATNAPGLNLASEDPRLRRRAVRELRRLGSPETVPSLYTALDDTAVDVRLDAVSALASIGGDAAVDALSAASVDDNAAIRSDAVYALATLSSAAALPAATRAIRDPDTGVRLAAVDALSEIGGEQTIEPLGAALQDSDATLRLAAVDALAELGDARSVQLLEQATTDADAAVGEAAAEALESIQARQRLAW